MTVALRIALLLLGTASPSLAAAEVLRARDAATLLDATARAQPGDTITLANGVWRDVSLVINSQGTVDRPITITAETPGGVIVSGRSGLILSGAHLVVSGLIFRDGYAAGRAVIETTPQSEDVRLAEIVIDGFNQPDRRTADNWVRLQGRGHRLERSWFARKGNAGPTVDVTGTHRIVGNYFGSRAPLGAAGGETVRASGPVEIAGNLFDRCDGGTAIVALLGGGAFRGNSVVQSQGSVVLRGPGGIAERNVFRGGAKPDTGGLLVTGTDVSVRHNYVERVAGRAIGIEGQAARATISANTIIDSARTSFEGGSARFERNLIRNTLDPIRSDGARVTFAGNVSSFDPPAVTAGGMVRDKHDFTGTPAGLLHLPTAASVGAPLDLAPVTASSVGPAWYPKPGPERTFAFAAPETTVTPGTLVATVTRAAPSAVLVLQPGEYRLDAPLVIDRPLTIRGKDARVRFSGATAFQLAAGGSLKLDGIAISGRSAPRRAGNAVIRAPLTPTTRNYTVMLDHVTLTDLDRGAGFDVVATTPGTLATRIDLRGVTARDVSGALVSVRGSAGSYAAQLVRITDSRLNDVGMVADVSGGAPGSGFGPKVEVAANEISGGGQAALRLTDVASATISGNRFTRTGAIELTAREEGSAIRCNRYAGTPMPRVSSGVTLEPDPQAPRCRADRLARGEGQ